MVAQTAQQRLQRVYDNYTQILVLVTEAIATTGQGPGDITPQTTQANIDAVIALADGSGIVKPKVTYGIDGVSVDWTGYQDFVLRQLKVLEQAIQRASGPFEFRSRGVT